MNVQSDALISSALNTYRSSSLAASAAKESLGKEKNSQQDRVTISREARVLARESTMSSSLLETLNGGGFSGNIGDEANRLFATLASTVGAQVRQFETGATEPFELFSDHAGAVRVKGDHPYRSEIEQMFREKPELANDLRKLSHLQTLQAKARHVQEFQGAYRKNPTEALNRFSWLFEGGSTQYFLKFEDLDVAQRVTWQGKSGMSRLLYNQAAELAA